MKREEEEEKKKKREGEYLYPALTCYL